MAIQGTDKVNRAVETMDGHARDTGQAFEKMADKVSGAGKKVVGTFEKVGGAARKLDGTTTAITIDLEGKDKATQGLNELKKQSGRLDGSTVRISTDLKGGESVMRSLDGMENVVKRVDGDKVTITAAVRGGQQAQGDLDRLHDAVRDVDGEDVGIHVETSGTGAAVGDLDRIERKMRDINGERATVEVESRGAPATAAALEGIQRIVAALSGKTAVVKVAVQGASGAAGSLAALGAEVSLLQRAMGAFAIVLPDVVYGLAPLLVGAATSAGVGVLALAGAIGSGLVGAMVAGAGAAAPLAAAIGAIVAPIAILSSHMKAYGTSVDQVKSAQDAAASAADAYKNSQQATANAVQNIGRVESQVADSISAAKQQETQTRKQWADTVESGNESVEAAEDSLDDAQDEHEATVQTLIAAEQDLKDVREDEPDRLAELEIAEDRARLARQQAAKAYDEAVKENGRNSMEAREALLDLRQAEIDERAAIEANREARAHGTEELIASKDAVKSARESESDAAKNVQDQEQALQQSREDAREANEAAYKAVVASEKAVSDAREEGRLQLEAAQEQAKQAREAELAALKALGEANDDVAEKTVHLTGVEKRLYDEFQRVKGVASELFQPAVNQTAMLATSILHLSERFLPRFAHTSEMAMRALRDVFAEFRTELRSSEFNRSLNQILGAVPGLIRQIGTLAAQAVVPVVGLFAKSLPYGQKLIDNIDHILSRFVKWLNTVEGENAVDRFLANSWHRAEQLGRAVWNLVEGFGDLFARASSGGLGDKLLGDVVRLTDRFSHLFDRGTKASHMIHEFGQEARPIFKALGGAVGEVLRQFFRVGLEAVKFREKGEKLSVIQKIFKALKEQAKPLADAMLTTWKEIGPLLPGLIRNFGGLVETFAGYDPMLKLFLQWMTGIMRTFNNLPPGVKEVAASLATFSAVIGTLGGGRLAGIVGNLLLFRKIGGAKAGIQGVADSLDNLGPSSKKAANNLDDVAGAAANSSDEMTLFGPNAGKAADKVDDVGTKSAKSGGLLKRMGGAIKGAALAVGGFTIAAAPWLIAIAAIAAAAYLIYRNWDRISKAIRPVTKAFDNFFDALKPMLRVLGRSLVGALKSLANGFLSAISPSLKLKNAGKQAGDVLDHFGKKVIPVVARAIRGLSNWLDKNHDTLRTVGKVVAWLATVQFRLLWKGIRVGVAIVRTVIKVFSFLVKTARDVGTAIGTRMRRSWENLTKIISNFIKNTRRNWSEFWKGMSKRWDAFKRVMRQGWDALWGGLNKRWQSFKKDVAKAWNSFWKDLNGRWQNFKKDVGKAWDDFWKGLSNRWEKFKRVLFDAWKNFWGNLNDRWQNFKKDVAKAWDDFWKGLSNRWEKFKRVLSDAWKDLWGNLKDRWQNFKKDLGNSWDDLWDGVGKRFEKFREAFAKARDNLIDNAKKAFSNFGDKVKDILGDRFEAAVNRVRKPLGFIAGAVASVLTAFGQGDLGDAVSKVAQKLKEPIKFAKGGVFGPGEVVIVGDEGQREFVINPKRPDNLGLLKQAANEMGQVLQPRAAGLTHDPFLGAGAVRPNFSASASATDIARIGAAKGGYDSSGATTHNWNASTQAHVNAMKDEFDGKISMNTYVGHGNAPGGGSQNAEQMSVDHWGPGGRGDHIVKSVGDQVVAFARKKFNDIYYYIWQGIIHGWGHARPYPDKSDQHFDHVHITYGGSSGGLGGTGGVASGPSLAERIWEGAGDGPSSPLGSIFQSAVKGLLSVVPGGGLLNFAADKWPGLVKILPDSLPFKTKLGMFSEGLQAGVGKAYKGWIHDWIYDKLGDVGGGDGGSTGKSPKGLTADEVVSQGGWPSGAHKTAVGVMWEESGFIANNGNGTYEGLFAMGKPAMNSVGMSFSRVHEPLYNSTAAAKLHGKMGWQPWAAYPPSASAMQRGNQKITGYAEGGVTPGGNKLTLELPASVRNAFLRVAQVLKAIGLGRFGGLDLETGLGGITKRITGIAGEAGREAIIPLTRKTRQGAGALREAMRRYIPSSVRNLIPRFQDGGVVDLQDLDIPREREGMWRDRGEDFAAVNPLGWNLVGGDHILGWRARGRARRDFGRASRLWRGVSFDPGGPGVHAAYRSGPAAGMTGSGGSMRIDPGFAGKTIARSLWAHEIGHALGLGHSNRGIMRPRVGAGMRPTAPEIRWAARHVHGREEPNRRERRRRERRQQRQQRRDEPRRQHRDRDPNRPHDGKKHDGNKGGGKDRGDREKKTVSIPDWLRKAWRRGRPRAVTRFETGRDAAGDEKLNWLIDEGWRGRGRDEREALYPNARWRRILRRDAQDGDGGGGDGGGGGGRDRDRREHRDRRDRNRRNRNRRDRRTPDRDRTRYKGRTDEHSSGGPHFGSTRNKLWSSETFGRVLEVLKRFRVAADTYTNHPPRPAISADFWAYAGRGHAISPSLDRQVFRFVRGRLRRGLSYQLHQGDRGHSGGQRHVHNTWGGKDPRVPNVRPRPIKGGMADGGIALRDGIARIAENNRPEAVIPFANAAPSIKHATREVMGTADMQRELAQMRRVLERQLNRMVDERKMAETMVRSILAAFGSRLHESAVDDLVNETVEKLLIKEWGA